ncbi:MAG: hypothetical protein QM647_05420 [Asticcacaulis sp.]|uniref:hypothetical protein n=1 Tax=Asticcacaulis sp. TaxID=1872648 RepID=UPI0039E60BE0
MKSQSLISAFICLLLASCSAHDVVTYATFKKISAEYTANPTGIPFADVRKIVGSEPKLSKGENVDGILVAKVPGEAVYYWINKDGSNISVTVDNGMVTGLAESALD